MHLAEVMHQAFMSMCNYTGELERAVNMGQIMHQAFTQMCNYAWELERTVSVLSTAPIAMQAYQQELDAAHRLIDVAHHMLTNPIYLLEHSFATFAQNIDANDAPFVSVLSRLYMALVEKHENMVQQQTGRYSDSYQQYLQSQIGKPWQQPMQQNLPPFPQSPQGNPPQNPGGLNANAVAFIKNMNQPGFGRMMQQNHVNQRQMRGM
jgi:predicted unusual protein kinase regulating ubiquinone biosynthesis (AarF/ABC1/UbiB family)